MKHAVLLLALFLPLSVLADSRLEYVEAMAREHAEDSPEDANFGNRVPAMPVSGDMVHYGEAFSGYLAKPANAGTGLPGLIVIHEWWGLNDNIRHMAELLAGLGYTALAVDLYDRRVATTPDQARAIMSQTLEDRERLERNILAAQEYLKEAHGAERTGSIGWCFGGAWSLQAALLLPETLDATVIYYGRLETDQDRLEPLQMPILGLFGGEDTGIPVESVQAFQAALDALGKEARIVIYEGAHHAFANPSGSRFQPAAAEDAWQRTTEFLAEHLKD